MADAKQASRWPFASGQESGMSELRDAVDDLVRKGAALSARSPWLDPLAKLRGPQPLEAPPSRRSGGRLDYVADLTDPSIAPLLTRRANRDGFAYIEEYPAMNLVTRTPLPELQARVKDLAAGKPVPRSAYGPRITYANDDPAGDSPRRPVSTATAGMVAAAALDAGLESVNINSTSGGRHSPNSNHYRGRAIDINRVNGSRVDSADGGNAAKALQNALKRQPNIRENYGPAFQEKTPRFGFSPIRIPSVEPTHRNHVHAAGQR